MALTKILTHANAYGDGQNFLGQFAEVVLPEIKNQALDHKTTDSFGKLKLPTALDALEMTLKASGFFEEFNRLAANPYRKVSMQIRANQQVTDGVGVVANRAVVVMVRGWFSERKLGTQQGGDSGGAKPEYKMQVHSYALVVDGAVEEEIDLDNHVHTVAGEDITADIRKNLGIV